MNTSQTPPAGHDDEPAASPRRGGSRLRRLSWIVAAVVATLVLAVVAAALLVPTERIARVASERAEAALGLPVDLGAIELDLWPTPAVALEGVRLGDAARPVASFGRVVLRPRLLPLLSGRASIRQIELVRPEVLVEVDGEGRLNLSFPEDTTAAAPGRDVEFSVDEFAIRDGRLTFRDARDGTEVWLSGIEQRLRIRGTVREGQLARVALDGTLAVDSANADLPGRLAVPVRGVRLAVTHAGSLDRDADRLLLESLRLEVQRVALEGSGEVVALSDSLARRVSVDLRADEFSADDLMRSLPEGLLGALLAGGGAGQPAGDAAAERPTFDGRAAIQASIRGLATRDSFPAVEGVVRLAGVSAELRDRRFLEGLEGRVDFSGEAVATEGLSGRLFDAPFRLAFRVDDLAAPLVAFSASGTASLDDLVLLAGVQDSISASGRLPFDLRGAIDTTEPARSELAGTVTVGEEVRVAHASLLQPIRAAGGGLRFAGDRVEVESVEVGLGESRVRVDATVADWLPAALGDSTRLPVVTFDAVAALLDLDALLGPSESQYAPLLFARLADRPLDGRSAAEAAAAAGLSLPELPKVHATGRFRADRLVRNGLEMRDVDARLESSPQAVSLPRAAFSFMGGTVEVGLALHRGEAGATLALDYRLRNVGADPFFSRLTPFRGHLAGGLSLEGEVAMQLDEQLLPVRPTVQAAGSMTLVDGWLASWPVLGAIGERLGVSRLDTLAFREWSGTYQISGPQVRLVDARQSHESVETEMAGSFDFGGQLDLGVVARLSPGLAERAGQAVRQAAAALAGADGRVPVGLRITGTAASPQIALDLSEARNDAVTAARDRAEQEARAVAERAAQEVARRVLPDSLPVRPDEVVDAVQSRIRAGLRGLVGRAAPDPAPAAPDSTPAPRDSTAAPDTAAPTD